MMAGILLVNAGSVTAETPGPEQGATQSGRNPGRTASVCESSASDSPYIPVDSWVYPAVLRLYSLGFVDDVYLGMRPWTRASVSHMLKDADARISSASGEPVSDEAQGIYEALNRELEVDEQGSCGRNQGEARMESFYSLARAISGTPLRDSFHLGQSIINDYGRPYENGFNNYSGASGYVSANRFLLYAREEFQGAPAASGYSPALAQILSNLDQVTYINPVTGLAYNQATMPQGPVGSTTDGRVVEAYVSTHVLNHEISFGKQDDWLGPGQGGAMAYSNNAENIYSFRINRIEPLQVPLLSRLTGPFRYEFLVGSLKGHIAPNDPWVHLEKISFRPTKNLEFGFERTVIWGGKGHAPITIHSFLRSFFNATNLTYAEKQSRNDPGARFSSADFSYRLPFGRNWLTLYTDSEVHDDVFSVSAPRRGAWRPGLYLSHVPGVPKLDVRVEAVTTDPPVSPSDGGLFMYWEQIQKQGYTNKGIIFGDWIGREAKGGQGWITYHLSGNEWVEVGVRNQKTPKDFIPGGTTLNDVNLQMVKRVRKDFEVNGNFSYEQWKAPVYLPGQHRVTTTSIQFTWFPQRKVSF
jgi:hypothetical protein